MMLRPLVRISLISTIACKHYLVEMEAKDRQEESSKYLVEAESKDRFEEGPDYPLGRSSRRGSKERECGRSNGPGETKIVGGENALKNEFPWQVRLSLPGSKPGQKILCGGSVLTREKILTAAHCTVRFSVQKITVWTRDHGRTREDGEMKHAVCNKTEHPEYNKKAKYDKDIAILHLCQPLVFNKWKFSKYFLLKSDWDLYRCPTNLLARPVPGLQ